MLFGFTKIYLQASFQRLRLKHFSKYKFDMNKLMDNIIGDMTYTSCKPTSNDYCNPNDLKEGESVFSFECLFSISAENPGFGGAYPYTKGFRLVVVLKRVSFNFYSFQAS